MSLISDHSLTAEIHEEAPPDLRFQSLNISRHFAWFRSPSRGQYGASRELQFREEEPAISLSRASPRVAILLDFWPLYDTRSSAPRMNVADDSRAFCQTWTAETGLGRYLITQTSLKRRHGR
jgi:hypothetical protein